VDSSLAGVLNANHVPALGIGEYALKFGYRLPGKDIQTSTVSRKIEIK